MMAASTSRLIHAASGDGGDSMTGSNNAGEVQPGKDRSADRRNKR